MAETVEHPLTWPQRDRWWLNTAMLREVPCVQNIVETWPLPDRPAVPDVRAALYALVDRHDGLRTTIDLAPDGQLVQRTAATAEPEITVVGVENTDATTDALTERIRRRPFRLDRDHPVRFTILTTAHRAVTVLACVHHVAVDRWGLDVLVGDFRALLTGSGQLPPAPQPRHIAEWESSPSGARQHSRALRRHRQLMATIPARLYPGVPVQIMAEPRHQATLRSPHARRALRTLSARHQVTEAAIVLAAYTYLLSLHSDHLVCAFITLSANRHREPLHRSVACLTQHALLTADLTDDPPFSEQVRRSSREYLAALRNSSHEYFAGIDTVLREGIRRGVLPETRVVFNYFGEDVGTLAPAPTSAPDDPPDTPGAGAPVTPPGSDAAPTLEWSSATDSFDELSLVAYTTPTELVLDLSVRAELMSRDDVELFVRGIDTVLIRAADGWDPRRPDIRDVTGLTAKPRRPGRWVVVDGCRTDLDDVTRMLRSLPGVERAHAAVDGQVLTGYVTGHAALTPEDLRQWSLEALDRHTAAIVPCRFVVCRTAPPSDTDSWAGQNVLRDGTGTTRRTIASPATVAERALVDAVAWTHPGIRVDLGVSYPWTGGLSARIMAVLRQLSGTGWHGVLPDDLASYRSLRHLAAQLRPLTCGGQTDDAMPPGQLPPGAARVRLPDRGGAGPDSAEPEGDPS
ncbi:MAG: condensation domain-containing protein [Actinocatenispora sp.]